MEDLNRQMLARALMEGKGADDTMDAETTLQTMYNDEVAARVINPVEVPFSVWKQTKQAEIQAMGGAQAQRAPDMNTIAGGNKHKYLGAL